MSKNLSRRSWAIAAAIAMGVSTFSVMPAQAAEGDVTLTPTVGSNLGAFSTDDFEMTAAVNTAVGLVPTALAFEITTAQDDVQITISTGVTGRTTDITQVTIRAYDAKGDLVELDGHTGSAYTVTGNSKSADIDLNGNPLHFEFDEAGATRLVISALQEGSISTPITASAVRIGVQPLVAADNSAYEYSDAATPDPITVRAWLDLDSDVSDVEATYASPSRTVTFFTPASVAAIPSIERFSDGSNSYLNDATDTTSQTLAGKIRFAQPSLNLDQVDLTNWSVEATTDASIRGFNETPLEDSIVKQKAGFKSYDASGALYFALDDTNGLDGSEPDAVSLDTSRAYGVEVTHDGATADDPKFNSVRFTPPANSIARDTFVEVTDSVNASQTNTEPTANDKNITLRPGNESFTYELQLFDNNGTETADRDETASVAVLVEVKANYLAEDATLSVSGSNTVLNAADQVAIVTGLTNADGEYAVTVTSSDASALTEYELKFYTLNANSVWENNNNTDTGNSTFTATYSSSSVAATDLVATNSTVSGETVTVEVTAEDSFGEPVSMSGTKALYVTFQGTDTNVLSETVAVGADGTASITFDNYVGSGESDIVTARLHTGASYSQVNQLLSTIISLYNPDSAVAVNVPESLTGNITYDDFIVGSASATNVAPDDNGMQITGTIVDTNGSGVPGASVTVDAAGMQLRQSGVGAYAQDSITFSANAAGQFTLDLWSHDVNPVGTDVTFTSNGVTATTTVKTYLPTGLSGGNLVFSLDAPANINVNQTYAIQASLTDKWGNPVATSGDSVDIVGIGSVEINSDSAGATAKNFGRDGKVTVFVRSIKDIEGPGTITATLQTGAVYATSATATDAVDRTEVSTDVSGTAHDETSFSNEIEFNINVGEAAQSSTQKVNAGSFKGYVAVYALGYEGQRLSAKIGNDWVIVDPIVNNESANLARVTDFTGAGYDIAVRIYIDRVLIDTINLTTK